jgi:hypothetical protein
MKTRYLLVALFIAATSFINGQIGSKANQSSSLNGTWQNSDNGFTNTLILETTGSGEFNGSNLTYKAQGNSLIVSMDGMVTNYSFQLKGSQLTLSGGDIQIPMIFTKSGTSANTKPVGTENTNTKTNSILGTWNGSNEVLVFNNNGTMNLNGYTLQYSIKGNTITIQTNTGIVNYTYELSGNYLTVNMNGQTAIYQKGNEIQNQLSNNQQSQNSSNKGQIKGHIAMELVGKWCWVNVNSTNSGGSSSSQCITINADGTYTYYGESSMSATSNYGYAGTASQSGDQGTWRLDGNTLNVMSQQQGFKSYTLQKINHPKNNDPMIVIDGQTFVTYYQKDPWR